MNLDKIVADLKSERDRIARAISALLDGAGLTGSTARSGRKAIAPKRSGGITPAGRRRLAAAMKARWAARRAQLAGTSNKASTKVGAAPKKRGGLTAAGRKRLSEAMKRRWAERKKAASKG